MPSLLMRARSTPALVALLLCVGCSDDDDDENDPAFEPSGEPVPFLTGGADCLVGAEGGAVLEMVDPETGDLIPVDPEDVPETSGPPIEGDAVDCDAFPATDLPPPGTRSLGEGFLARGDRSIPIDNMVSIDENLSGPDDAGRAGIGFVLHDGETRVRELSNSAGSRRIDYGAFEATVAVGSTLYAEGDTFDGRTFQFVRDDLQGEDVPDGDVLEDGVFVFDADGDGEIELGELSEIMGGQLTWVGTPPTIILDLNLILADGTAVTGRYEGDVLELDLSPDE